MGGAIARGLIASSNTLPVDIEIIDSSSLILDNFRELGVNPASDTKDAEVVIIALKPWLAQEAKKYLEDFHGTIISVMAGISLSELGALYGSDRIVRVMPNIAVERCCGVSFIASNSQIDRDIAHNIFSTLGLSKVTSEDSFDAYMALGSCGLAYALRYVRAATLGAVELGIKPREAEEVLGAVLRGTASLLEGGKHPEALVDEVTTPGGITIRGLNAMEDAGFTSAVIAGLRASK